MLAIWHALTKIYPMLHKEISRFSTKKNIASLDFLVSNYDKSPVPLCDMFSCSISCGGLVYKHTI